MTSQLLILNKILETKDYSIISSNRLDASYFSDYNTEFNFIKSHYEKYGIVPDKIVFLDSFPEFDIVKVNEPNSFLLEQLFEESTGNYLAEQFNTVKRFLESGDVNKAKNIFNNVGEKLAKMRTASAISCTDLTTDFSRYDRYVERCANRDNYYISTGFPELDEAIGGIDRENEDMVIIARTGIGKSWTAIKMAVAASSQGLRVGFYSGEMSKDKVGYRFDTLFGHINNKSITRGDDKYQSEYKRYIGELKAHNCGPLFVLTPQDIGGAAKVSDLAGFIQEKQLDILFIDQYSLLEDVSGARAENEKIANISKAIKNLQVMAKIPIVSVSQQNRTKSETGEIDTTMVFGSDRIGQDSTVLIAIDKKEITVPDRKYPDTVFTLNILKARDGASVSKLQYKVDLNNGYFNFIDENNNMTQEEADAIAAQYDYTDEDYAASGLPF